MITPFDGPLDLTSTLESGQVFRWSREEGPGESGVGWYRGVVFNNLVRMRQVPGGIEFICEPDDESTLEPLVRDFLRLNDDLDTIYDSVGKDDHIRSAITRYRGLRILRQDPWECLVSFICSANSNIPRISANARDLGSSFGRPIVAGRDVGHIFPGPAALADAGEQRLRELGLGFRAKYVAATAEVVAHGAVDLFALRETPYQEALDALTALPGVGDKVANCVLLFSLDKLEAFPVDVWVSRALREWYVDTLGNGLAAKDMRPWAQEYFGAYAGYADQYLFHGRRLQR